MLSSVVLCLRDEIKARGITYSFISGKTGIPVDHISKVFLGRRKLLSDELLMICAAINLDPILLIKSKEKVMQHENGQALNSRAD